MYRLSSFTLALSLVLFSWSCWSAPLSAATVKRSAVVPKLAGSPVIFGAGTYPRANSLSGSSMPAGSIIGAYTAFQNGNNVLKTVLSTDNGASWQALGEIASEASNANDLDNPNILQLPSGRVLCAFRNHSKNPSTGAYTYFRITVSYSDDLGKSWKYLSTPSSDPGPVNGNWEPFLRNAKDGSLQIYYSRENSAADQDTLERFSTDGGETWTNPQTISGSGITARDGRCIFGVFLNWRQFLSDVPCFRSQSTVILISRLSCELGSLYESGLTDLQCCAGMTGVTTISGTTLMAVFESETNGLFTVNSITSSDDGKTWGNRETVYTPDSPNTSAGAPQIVNVGGTLCVSFMTNEDSQLSAPSNGYTTDTAAKFITSGDGGVTWGNKITVGQVLSVWPGLYSLGETSLLMLFDNQGAKSQTITLS